MKRALRYFIMFNPVSMVLFCLLPTVESRRGLLLFKLKEVFSMKFDQVKESIKTLFSSPDHLPTRTFSATYLGHKKAFVSMSEADKRALEGSEKVKTIICLTPDRQDLRFSCSVYEDDSFGIKVRFSCLSAKKMALISNPANYWYFSFY